MIRPAHEDETLNDDEYFKIIEPSYKEIRKYLDNDFIYHFVAKCIATDYKNNSIWSSSSLELEFRDAMDFLSNMPVFSKIDKNKLIETLKAEYSLEITNIDPIEIKEINS